MRRLSHSRVGYPRTMATLEGRDTTALVVIDVQNDVVEGSFERETRVANIATLVERARSAGTPVVWVQHSDAELLSGSTGWQIVDELRPQANEPLIHKHYRSSFESTTLDSVLDGLSAGRLVVCGAQTNYCIRNTVHAAFERGYDVTLVTDAHTTTDELWPDGLISAERVIAEFNHACLHYDLPGRSVRAVETADVSF